MLLRGIDPHLGTRLVSRAWLEFTRYVGRFRPKSLLYLAGWGWGSATLDGATLYDEHQIHFMITQGMRDRETLVVRTSTGTDAGAVNPAQMQLDFYIRSPESNERNHPTREVFDHFFAMEVTWR